MTSRDTVPDVQIEPPEICGHQEWESTERIWLDSELPDINMVCLLCNETGTLKFKNEEQFSVDWS